MAQFVKFALLNVFLYFFTNSAVSESQEFIGPKLYETEETNLSPIFGEASVALTNEEIPYASDSKIDKAKARKELLDEIETMNAYVKFVAEDLTNDGVVIVRALRGVNLFDPPIETEGSLVEENQFGATSTSPEKKLSSSQNSPRSATGSRSKRVSKNKCERDEALFPNLDTVD